MSILDDEDVLMDSIGNDILYEQTLYERKFINTYMTFRPSVEPEKDELYCHIRAYKEELHRRAEVYANMLGNPTNIESIYLNGKKWLFQMPNSFDKDSNYLSLTFLMPTVYISLLGEKFIIPKKLDNVHTMLLVNCPYIPKNIKFCDIRSVSCNIFTTDLITYQYFQYDYSILAEDIVILDLLYEEFGVYDMFNPQLRSREKELKRKFRGQINYTFEDLRRLNKIPNNLL